MEQHTQNETPEKPEAKKPRSASGFRECKTFRKKVEHFWAYYKWYAFAAVAVIAIIVTTIVQNLTAVEPDIQIICYTSNVITTGDMEFLRSRFQEELSTDINGDGEMKVAVYDYSYNSDDISYQQGVHTKIQMAMAAEDTILLYITDSESMKFFENDSFEGAFHEPALIREDFLTRTDTLVSSIPKELYIQCRRVDSTRLEDVKGIREIYAEALRIMNSISNQE